MKKLIFHINYYWLIHKSRKDFANDSSVNLKLLKTQIRKIVQSGGFLGIILGPLLRTG